MSKLLDQAFDAIRHMPPAGQEALAKAILILAKGDQKPPEDIDPAHLPAILASLAQAERGEFASDAEVEAVFRRFGE